MTKKYCDLCKKEVPEHDLKSVAIYIGTSGCFSSEGEVCTGCRNILTKEIEDIFSRLRVEE